MKQLALALDCAWQLGPPDGALPCAVFAGGGTVGCHVTCVLLRGLCVCLCAELREVEAAAGFQGAGQSAQQARGQILLTRRGTCVLQRPPRCVLDACCGLSPSLLCIDHRNYNKLRTIFPHSRRLHLRSDD